MIGRSALVTTMVVLAASSVGTAGFYRGSRRCH
jgi:hypothetical protein